MIMHSTSLPASCMQVLLWRSEFRFFIFGYLLSWDLFNLIANWFLSSNFASINLQCSFFCIYMHLQSTAASKSEGLNYELRWKSIKDFSYCASAAHSFHCDQKSFVRAPRTSSCRCHRARWNNFNLSSAREKESLLFEAKSLKGWKFFLIIILFADS